jgi:hypothetical protein
LRGSQDGAKPDPAPGQPRLQTPPSSPEAAPDRAFLQPQLPSNFRPAVAFQKTQDERRPIFVGQALNLVIESGLNFTPVCVVVLPARRQNPSLMRPPPGGASFRLHGNSMCDSMKPGGQRLALADRAGSPGQNQKRGLKRILRILLVPEHEATHTQNERTVSLDQNGESRLIAAFLKLLQQLPIAAFFRNRQGNQPVYLVNDSRKDGFSHGINSASD